MHVGQYCGAVSCAVLLLLPGACSSTSSGSAAPTNSCTADLTLAGCTGNSIGYSCLGSDTPADDFASLTCEAGTGGGHSYCCTSEVAATAPCVQDTAVTAGCTDFAVGYSCTGTSTPAAADVALQCDTGTAGNNGTTLYCCTVSPNGTNPGDAAPPPACAGDGACSPVDAAPSGTGDATASGTGDATASGTGDARAD